jgi:DNA-binding NtrC family response regulator
MKILYPEQMQVSLSVSQSLDTEVDIENLCQKQLVRQIPFRDAKQEAVELYEAKYLKALLQRTNGNISEAARHCQMDRRNFQKLLNKYGL